MESGDGFKLEQKERVVIRGFHIDPKKDRGVFWVLVDGKQVDEFDSLAEVEAYLESVVDRLQKKYSAPIGLRVSWDIDYPNNQKTTQKPLEECSPSYRGKKKAWLEGIKNKKKK